MPLPAGQPVAEARRVLAGAARDLEHEARFRQERLQDVADRLAVALGGRPRLLHLRIVAAGGDVGGA